MPRNFLNRKVPLKKIKGLKCHESSLKLRLKADGLIYNACAELLFNLDETGISEWGTGLKEK
jgi:hypothetical protein